MGRKFFNYSQKSSYIWPNFLLLCAKKTSWQKSKSEGTRWSRHTFYQGQKWDQSLSHRHWKQHHFHEAMCPEPGKNPWTAQRQSRPASLQEAWETWSPGATAPTSLTAAGTGEEVWWCPPPGLTKKMSVKNTLHLCLTHSRCSIIVPFSSCLLGV